MKFTAQILRWSDAKLEKELTFAGPADDGGPECLAWNKALAAECKRRELDWWVPSSLRLK